VNPVDADGRTLFRPHDAVLRRLPSPRQSTCWKITCECLSAYLRRRMF